MAPLIRAPFPFSSSLHCPVAVADVDHDDEANSIGPSLPRASGDHPHGTGDLILAFSCNPATCTCTYFRPFSRVTTIRYWPPRPKSDSDYSQHHEGSSSPSPTRRSPTRLARASAALSSPLSFVNRFCLIWTAGQRGRERERESEWTDETEGGSSVWA